MRQIINIVVGFISSLAPLAITAIIGLGVYASLPNLTGVVIIGLLVIPAIWIGLQIFRRVQIVGPIEFMTAIHDSPDLDNLEPTTDSETKRRKPDEVVELLAADKTLFKGGSIRIYGDWFGKPGDNYHVIESAHFDTHSYILTLNFIEREKLEIFNPVDIFEASTFLKILKADRIKLTWHKYGETQKTENLYFLDYRKKDKKIETDTNVDWYKPKFSVSLGDPALMIYG